MTNTAPTPPVPETPVLQYPADRPAPYGTATISSDATPGHGTRNAASRRPGSVVAALRGVSKDYGSVHALQDVDLEIRSGEVFALLGPNGAGKTTAVNLLLGLIRPTAGQASLFGGSPDDVAAKVRVGAMLQISGVPSTLKVREHLELFASYYPAPLAVADVLEMAELSEVANRLYGKLSGGQRQRLHFALALIGDPDLLFLDEPTTGLDVSARRSFWRTIRSFIGSGRTVVLTTHYLEEADALADDVAVIDHGHVIARGTPGEIKSRTAGRRIRAVTRLTEASIMTIEGVRSVAHNGAQTEILATLAEPVVRELLNRDPDLHDLEVTGAGLEEAFLALTHNGGEA